MVNENLTLLCALLDQIYKDDRKLLWLVDDVNQEISFHDSDDGSRVIYRIYHDFDNGTTWSKHE